MSKRSAIEEAPGVHEPKRQNFDDIDFMFLEEPDDDFTSVQTPDSVTVDAESPVTAATTPRAKFPSDLKTLPCTWPGCPKTFNRPARLRDHLNSHTNSRPFQCPYDGCDKDYIEDKHLKQHIKAVHTHERKHVCQKPGCGKSFVTGTRLKRHQAVHEGADRFRCQTCGQSFRKKETLNKHVLKEHMGLPPHQCSSPGCAEAFQSKGALKRHQQKVHGEVKFWCSECAPITSDDGSQQRVGFTTEVLLQAHLKQEHQNCMFCDYKSSTQADMLAHIDMHHSGKTVQDRKTVLCPYEKCYKRFTKKSNLTTHIRTAHEGFRFVCGGTILSCAGLASWANDQGCGDTFSTKIRLEDHVRFIHLGQERPKVSYPVSSQTDFIDNMTGSRRQARYDVLCTQCDAAFTRYHDLNVHIENIHGNSEVAPVTPLQSQLADPTSGGFDPSQLDWQGTMPEEGIFAAEIKYSPPRDGWLEDEADIMLLARDTPESSHNIDPSLRVD